MVQLWWWWVAAEEVDATNGRDKISFSHETQEKGKLLVSKLFCFGGSAEKDTDNNK